VKGNACTRALAALDYIAGSYRSQRAQDDQDADDRKKGRQTALEPVRSESAQVMANVESTARAFLASLVALEGHDNALGRIETRTGVPTVEIARLVAVIAEAACGFNAQGRPSQDTLGVLINQLALVWEEAHGRWPGRSYSGVSIDGDKGGGEGGPFPRFVAACLVAMDSDRAAKVPAGLIRKVLRGRRQVGHMDKNANVV
jgi:hypothetical protein